MNFNSDFRHDLEYGVNEGEKWFDDVMQSNAVKTIEVKCDRMTEKTGNLYIEYLSRGKPSGIKTTQAKYWVYKFGKGQALLFETQVLKDKLRSLVNAGKAKMNVKGGDNNTSLGVLVKVKDLV